MKKYMCKLCQYHTVMKIIQIKYLPTFDVVPIYVKFGICITTYEINMC